MDSNTDTLDRVIKEESFNIINNMLTNTDLINNALMANNNELISNVCSNTDKLMNNQNANETKLELKLETENSKLIDNQNSNQTKLELKLETENSKLIDNQNSNQTKLESKLETENSKLMNNLNANQTKLELKLDTENSKLMNNLNANQTKLELKLDTENSKLMNNLNSNQTKLESKLETENSKLMNNLNSNQTKLESKLETENSKLIDNQNSNQTKLELKLDTENSKLMNNLNSNQTKLESKLETENSKLMNNLNSNETKLELKLETENSKLMNNLNTNETKLESKLETENSKLIDNQNSNQTKLESKLETENSKLMNNLNTNETKLESKLETENSKLMNNLNSNQTKLESKLETENSKLIDNMNTGISGLKTNTDKLISQTNALIDNTKNISTMASSNQLVAESTVIIKEKTVSMEENIKGIKTGTDKIVVSNNGILTNATTIKDNTTDIKYNTEIIGKEINALTQTITNSNQSLIKAIKDVDSNESIRDSDEMKILKETNNTMKQLTSIVENYILSQKESSLLIDKEEERIDMIKIKAYNLQILSIILVNKFYKKVEDIELDEQKERSNLQKESKDISLLMQKRLYFNNTMYNNEGIISNKYEKDIISYKVEDKSLPKKINQSNQHYSYNLTNNEYIDEIEFIKLKKKIMEIKNSINTNYPFLRLKVEYCFLNDDEIIPFASYITDANNNKKSYPIIICSDYKKNTYNLSQGVFEEKQNEYIQLIKLYSQINNNISIESFIDNHKNNTNHVNLYNPNKTNVNNICITTYTSKSTLKNTPYIKKLTNARQYKFVSIPKNGQLEFFNGETFIEIKTQGYILYANNINNNYIRYSPNGDYSNLKSDYANNNYLNINNNKISFSGENEFIYNPDEKGNISEKINVLNTQIYYTVKNKKIIIKPFRYGFNDVLNSFIRIVDNPQIDTNNDPNNDYGKTKYGEVTVDKENIIYTPEINKLGEDSFYYNFNIDDNKELWASPIQIKIIILDDDIITEYPEQQFYVKTNSSINIQLIPFDVLHQNVTIKEDNSLINIIDGSINFNSQNEYKKTNLLDKWSIYDNNNYCLNDLYSKKIIDNMKEEIKNNNILIASFGKKDFNIDYMSFYNLEFYDNNQDADNDRIKLLKLYDGDLYRMTLDDKNNISEDLNIQTFADLYKNNIGLSVIVYDFKEINIEQKFKIKETYINIPLDNIDIDNSNGSNRVRNITKTMFNCLVIANIDNDYYYKVDIIEDYFGYVKYNDVNIYKININSNIY
jgi:hypothetical protein